mmetsp:Transcript_15012/g.35775  ORF Transcript_15012/g.35775 Transcript_15012/m.35775 type:complete len:260 (+) Transcript_15012:1401-2180(+)
MLVVAIVQLAAGAALPRRPDERREDAARVRPTPPRVWRPPRRLGAGGRLAAGRAAAQPRGGRTAPRGWPRGDGATRRDGLRAGAASLAQPLAASPARDAPAAADAADARAAAAHAAPAAGGRGQPPPPFHVAGSPHADRPAVATASLHGQRKSVAARRRRRHRCVGQLGLGGCGRSSLRLLRAAATPCRQASHHRLVPRASAPRSLSRRPAVLLRVLGGQARECKKGDGQAAGGGGRQLSPQGDASASIRAEHGPHRGG